MAGVGQTVAQAYKTGVWTRVEVVKADVRKGNVYLELAERDLGGSSLAEARGMIWTDTANQIVPAFERSTGAVLGAGIKLLVRARPTAHRLYGLSLVIDAIDPDYTLGDFEACKREIRARLQREGFFDANRQLPQPWDYNAVLVIAPQGAAGHRDFQGEAQRLERFGICSFTYAHSRFQGEVAAAEIRGVLLAVLDITQTTRRAVDQADAAVRGGALRHLALASEHSTRMLADVRLDALKAVRDASDRSHESFFEVRDQVLSQLSEVRQSVPALLAEVRSEARLSIRSARVQSDTELGAMLERTAWGTRQARDVIETALRDVAAASRRITSDVINGSEALMREIAGQGPEKTLGRGFAVVRKTDGTALTSARDTAGKVSIEIQFHDGKVAARTADEQGSERQ